MNLKEGGNVFKDADKNILTKRINQADVDPTLKWLEQVLQIDLVNNKLGTTGRRDTSGDLDIAVDQAKYSKDDLVAKLSAWCKQHNLNPKEWIKKSGISVHFKTPINGDDKQGYVQTDLMFGEPSWMAWSLRGAYGDSPFKGMHRQVLMSSLAKVNGLTWSPNKGLLNRETKEIVSKDADEIARMLLGNGAKKDDLEDVESIIAFIKNHPNYNELVADARDVFAKDGLELPESIQEGTARWMRDLMDNM